MKIRMLWIITLCMIICASIASCTSSEYLPHKQRTDLSFGYADSDAGSWCNATGIQHTNPSSFVKIDIELTKDKNTFYGTIEGGNFTNIEDICIWIECEDGQGSVCRAVDTQAITKENSFLVTAIILGIAIFLSLFLYTKVSRFVGSLMIFIIGLGILFTMTDYGWIGWIIIACGFIMVIYSLMNKPKKRMRKR